MVADITESRLLKIIDEIHLLRDKYRESIEYWEKLNVNPCRKYSFYQHAIHLDSGIYILLGSYKQYDRINKDFTVLPMIRLEVNPNKHGKKPVLIELLALLNAYCYESELNRYDYAIDIPVEISKVKVFGSHKEQGLYKGTLYYGQRNKNGFCRIYDKAKEQDLDTPLTRVEHVFSLTKTTKNISFERIYIEKDNKEVSEDNKKISKTDSVIVSLCNLCKMHSLDFDDIIRDLDKRKYEKIIRYLSSSGYEQLEFNAEIHDRILQQAVDYFSVKNSFTLDKPEILEQETIVNNGFLEVDDSVELPFN